MNQTNSYNVIGLMSGTSLDGLDIAFCNFNFQNKQWNFKIVSCETISYPKELYNALKNAESMSGLELSLLNNSFGDFIGNQVDFFLKKRNLSANLIASHGHTVFHQTDKRLSLQIGNGANITAKTKTTTISNFRDLDIALGGQGAPLVPNGEKELFSEFNCFLNLGGIANISIHTNNRIIGFDITVANMLLNYYSKKYFNREFDDNGDITRKGIIDEKALGRISSLAYFSSEAPKSLGKEYIFEQMLPIVNSIKKPEDAMRTIIAHISNEFEKTIIKYSIKENVLVSGGGAFNNFLIDELIKKHPKIILPTNEIIEYKEALIFAFLGLKRFLNQTNCYKSITGAERDSSSGSIFLY